MVLLETVRIREGQAPLWPLHQQRLAASCAALGLPFPLELVPPAGGPDRAWRVAVGAEGTECTEREVGSTAPLTIMTSSVPHPGYPHKTDERAALGRALEEAREAGATEALLLTRAGVVAEAANWCVYWWEGERLAAPALDLDILPGVSRRRIEQLAGPLLERRVPRVELAGRSLLLSNALRGIVEVASLDGVPLPSDPRSAALAERFWT